MAAGQPGGPGAGPRRSVTSAAVAVASVGLAATGCSTASLPPGNPAATATTTVPTLGQLAGLFAHGRGFGQARPSEIFNGGDPTGLVTRVVWKSWGGAEAVATGITDYVGPNQTVAGGRQEPVTVVAFKLGTCDGRLMYEAVEWYFPQHRQAFDARRYEDICTGTYVPGSSRSPAVLSAAEPFTGTRRVPADGGAGTPARRRWR